MKLLFSSYGLLIILLLIPFVLIFINSQKGSNRLFFVLLLWIIGIGPIIAELFINRSQSTGVVYGQLTGHDFVYQFITLFALIISLVIIGNRIIYRNRYRGGASKSTIGLFVGVVVFSLGSVLSAVFGTVPKISANLLLLPLITFITLICIEDIPFSWFISNVKLILFVYVFGSLISILVAPSWAISPYSSLFEPLINFRLWGVASHPNSLGPLALVFLVLNSGYPWKTKPLSTIANLLAIIVFILAQSKTAYIGGFIVLVYLFLYNNRQTEYSRLKSILFYFVLLISATILISFADHTITDVFNSPSFRTLTGRIAIWTITLEYFFKDPIIGYGPTLWDEDFRYQYSMSYAGQSHNQYIQTLGSSGIIGLICLMIFIYFIFFYAKRINHSTKGISIGLFIILIIRTITETPLRLYNLDNSFFLFFVLYTFLILQKPLVRQGIEQSSTLFAWQNRVQQNEQQYR